MLNIFSRGALASSIARFSRDTIELIYRDKVASDDGSFSVTERNVNYRGMLVALSDKEIMRLQVGGISISEGHYVAIADQLDSLPDEIRARGNLFKVVKTNVNEGCTVFLMDKKPISIATGAQVWTP